jgi:hypothetical protein
MNALAPKERDEILTQFPELEDRDVEGDLKRYELKRYEARALRLSA